MGAPQGGLICAGLFSRNALFEFLSSSVNSIENRQFLDLCWPLFALKSLVLCIRKDSQTGRRDARPSGKLLLTPFPKAPRQPPSHASSFSKDQQLKHKLQQSLLEPGLSFLTMMFRFVLCRLNEILFEKWTRYMSRARRP